MAESYYLFCATCGKRMNRSQHSLPQGQARCHQCRRATHPAPAYRTGAVAPCKHCGREFVVQVGGQRLCHAPCMPKRSGTPDKPCTAAQRGYGPAHKAARAEALAQWQDGDPCARCGGPMRHGTPVDLDHNDDRTGYLGLSHRACNRSHTGRLTNAARPAVCDHCGVPYTARRETQRYCSVPCRKADGATRPKRSAPVKATKPCRHCGQETTRPAYCSDSCARDAVRDRARERSWQRARDRGAQERGRYGARKREGQGRVRS